MGENRLTREDWVKAGLAALAREGVGALKADRLARELGVSRGSFYWHFADIGAFRTAVLEGWQAVAYENIVAGLARLEGDDRLATLVAGALQGDGKLETAMRAWAAHDPAARAMVASVDARRVAYLVGELVAAGGSQQVAEARARVLYWTYLGSFFVAEPPEGAMREAVADELTRFADGRRDSAS